MSVELTLEYYIFATLIQWYRSYLDKKLVFLAQDKFGIDLQAVEAATKKHEAIETDVKAYEERVQAVVSVANELEAENYYDFKRINAR